MWPFLIPVPDITDTIDGSKVLYTGPNLPSLGVQTNENLNVALQKIDILFNTILNQITTTTTTTTLTTTSTTTTIFP